MSSLFQGLVNSAGRVWATKVDPDSTSLDFRGIKISKEGFVHVTTTGSIAGHVGGVPITAEGVVRVVEAPATPDNTLPGALRTVTGDLYSEPVNPADLIHQGVALTNVGGLCLQLVNVYHIKQGGTRASGASVANDWTNANCYPITSLPAVWGDLVDKDQVIFDNQAAHTVAAQLVLNGLAGTLGVSFKSRVPGSPYTINRTADVKIFIFNGLSNVIDIEIQDAKFTSVGAIGNDKFLLQIANGIQKFQLTNCDFSGLQITSTSGGGNGQLLFFDHDGGTPEAIFKDCNFSNINASVANSPVVHVSRSIKGRSIGLCDFSNTQFTTNTSIAGRGFFYHSSNAVGEYDEFELSGFSATGNGTGAFRPFFNQSTLAGHITINKINGNNIAVACGGAETGGLIFGQKAGILKGGLISNLHFNNTGNHEGGVLVTFQNLWEVSDLIVEDSSGAFGMVFATSFDGSIKARNCIGRNLSPGAAGVGNPFVIDHGIAFYAGGSGDCFMRECIGQDNVTTEDGTDFFLLHNIAAGRAKRDAFLEVEDCIFTSAGIPVNLFNRSEDGGNGRTVSAKVSRCTIDGGSGGIIVSDITQTGTDSIINLLISDSYTRDIDNSSQLAGTTTVVNPRPAP